MHRVSLLVLIAVPALAQTVYSWEDEDGVHYTDDPAQVPKKGQRVDVQSAEGESRPSRPATIAPSPPSRPATSPTGPDNEREWRDRFVTAHRRISTLKQELSALETSLPPPTRCVTQQPTAPTQDPDVVVLPNPAQTRTRCEPNPLYERFKLSIEQKKVEVRDAELDLEQLDRQASYDSVPREWRRGW